MLALWAGSAAAAPADLDVLFRQCGLQLKLADKGCRCIIRRAAVQLSDKQQALAAAAVTRNRAKSEILSGQLTPDEISKAGRFMLQVPRNCAGGGPVG
jgi:hypothetical protein